MRKIPDKSHRVLHNLIVVEFLVIYLIILSFSSLQNEYHIDSITYPANYQALTHYQIGNYRHCVVTLKNLGELNDVEYYLLARSFFEMEEYEEANLAFYQVLFSNLFAPDVPSFIPENFIYYYSKSLMLEETIDFTKIGMIEWLASQISKQSIYYADVQLVEQTFYAVLTNPSWLKHSVAYDLYLQLGGTPQHSDELYDGWAQSWTSLQWSKEAVNIQIRNYLRKDPDKAWDKVLEKLQTDDEFYWHYVAGMLYFHEKEYSDAYKHLMEVCLLRPFTYEWFVATHYESIMRDDHELTWKTSLLNKMDDYWSYNLKEKCYYGVAFLYMNPARFVSEIGTEYLKTVMNSYEDSFLEQIETDQVIPELEGFTNQAYFVWSPEVLNYVEYYIDKYSLTKDDKRKLTYQYRKIYHSLKAEGYVVNRLDTLAMKILEDRRYFVILPDKILYELYPLLGLEIVLSNMETTNRALWAMASFREESHFLKTALSHVGARGVAQIMPYTEDSLKLQLGNELLTSYDFADNIYMGSALHQYLFERYDENIMYSLAAYNGGEGAVNRWIKKYNYLNELWVESIPYEETRGYVRRIMESRMFYEFIYE